MVPPHAEAGREEWLLRRARPSAPTSAPPPRRHGARRGGGHRAAAPPLPLPLWRASPSGSSMGPTRSAAPASLASLPLLLSLEPWRAAASMALAGGELGSAPVRPPRTSILYPPCPSAAALELTPPRPVGDRAPRRRARAMVVEGSRQGGAPLPGQEQLEAMAPRWRRRPARGLELPSALCCPKPWRSLRWARSGPARAAGLFPPHRRTRRPRPASLAAPRRRDQVVGDRDAVPGEQAVACVRRRGGGARRPASGREDHGGGARRMEMEGRERGREIREGGRKGADGRRQKYTGGFLQIFATVVTCGMPRRLRTLVWRIWDLR